MGIKKSVAIVAEVLAVKPSRIAADAAMQQALDLLRQDEQATTRKAKHGVQGATGRTRSCRVAREERFVTVTLSKGHYWVDLDIEI